MKHLFAQLQKQRYLGHNISNRKKAEIQSRGTCPACKNTAHDGSTLYGGRNQEPRLA